MRDQLKVWESFGDPAAWRHLCADYSVIGALELLPRFVTVPWQVLNAAQRAQLVFLRRANRPLGFVNVVL